MTKTASSTIRSGTSRRRRRLRCVPTLALLVLLLAATTAGVAQAAPAAMSAGLQWYWLSPTPQGNAIEDIAFSGPSLGWAVGWNGTVLTTADGGVTWRQQASGTTSALHAVSFPTASDGWAVGADGVILHTADGGRHWSAQTSGTSEWLYGVAFANATHGWAVGGSWDGPVLLATTDGGQTWQPQSSPSGSRLLAVDCTDATHAWAVGEGGVLSCTTDGGADWNMRYLNGSTSPRFCAVEFVDGMHGWAADTYGAVAVTVDGGDSWDQIEQDAVTYGLTDIAVVRGSLWLSAPQGVVLTRPVDGGTWTPEDTGLYGNLHALAPQGTGLVAGGHAGALATRAGGGWIARWTGHNAELQSVTFTDAQHGWAAGQKGGGESVAVLYATADGGRTWTRQIEDDPLNWLGGVTMADAQHGWAAGWGGGIVHTDDGISWTPQVAPTWPATNYYAVACGDAQHAVAVGYPGNGKNLSVTADGGGVWATPPSGIVGSLEDVDFGDATHVWAVGDKGAITASADAGAGWTPQSSGVTADLKAVHFIDASNGWAAGAGGVIVHTSDGGITWSPQASGVTSAIQAIGFVSALEGWAVTGDGEILETRDGGAGWGNGGRRCDALLNDLAAIDATRVFAVGGYGTVLGLDVLKPVVRATAPRRAQRRPVRVRIKATDAQSGVAWVRYRVGKGAWKTGTGVRVTRRGKTVVSYRAADVAGNVSVVRKVTVRVRR